MRARSSSRANTARCTRMVPSRSSPSKEAFTAGRWRRCRLPGRRRSSRCSSRRFQGFRKARWNDLASVERLINDNTVAVMLEPIQGEAGVWPASDQFLRDLRALTLGARSLADLRRDPDRHGPYRQALPLRAHRRYARYHDARQRHRRRCAVGCAARHGGGILLRAWRSGRHVQRQCVDVRGRARGTGTGQRLRNS